MILSWYELMKYIYKFAFAMKGRIFDKKVNSSSRFDNNAIKLLLTNFQMIDWYES